MPLRDLALTIVVLGSLPVALVSPYVGVLVWTWLGFMNPHRMVWGFASTIPFAQLVAAATLAGLLASKDRRPVPLVRESVLLASLWVLFCVSTLGALYPSLALPDLKQVSKVLLMIFVTVMVCQSREQLRGLLLVSALSVGFFGFKGGVWGVVTGGESGWVLGPETSMLGDNNGLAMALNMVLPFLFFLGREEPRRWLRYVLRATFFLSIISVILTYSRSGALGLAVSAGGILLSTKRKGLAAAIAVIGGIGLLFLLPERWYERLGTITTYSADGSAMARIRAWTVSWRLALDHPLFGGGFRALQPDVWATYLPEYDKWHNAHSIYFHMLAEHGFTGFALSLTLYASTLWSLRTVRRRAQRVPGAGWIVEYSLMVQTSLLAYLVTGAFQNLTYFDLFYLLIAVTIILKQIMRDLTEAPLTAGAASGAQAPSRARFPARALARVPAGRWGLPAAAVQRRPDPRPSTRQDAPGPAAVEEH
jgi:probable O-glycosylation ligase (exosortase A-associated)